MGIYVFNKEVLSDLLTNSTKMDFGKEIIPAALPNKKTYAYMYSGYWRDIGSIKSFYKENLAFTDPNPPLDLFDENWQFFTRPRYLPPSKIQSSYIEDSNIAEGSIIEKAKIKHSIIGLRTRIWSGSVIEDSVLMGCDYYENTDNNTDAAGVKLGIGKNCRISKAIVDKNARIGDGAEIINKDNLKEFENDYCVIRDGIIIIPKNTIIPLGTVI
jgi:glucose-1-phosphate adenylyltransferase